MKNQQILTGRGVSDGVSEGIVHLMEDPTAEPPSKQGKGIILVAPYFTPISLPAFIEAGGIVTDKGGTTSHAAIIARELGIPAVTAVDTATEVLNHNDKIRINGSSGQIRILKDG